MKFRAFMSFITISVLLSVMVPEISAQDASTNADQSTTTAPANPAPLINQPLIPDAIKPGAARSTLTVNGTGFVSGSVVKWNGSVRATTFVSRSRLIATILSSDIAKPHTASVTVVNPGPGGGTSNVAFFEVTSPTLSISLGASEFGAGSSPLSVAVGDFNGDGKLDLAVANDDLAGTVSVLLGNGDGTFQAAVNYGAGTGTYSVTIGDFNGDGKLDLAVANAGSDNVSVLLGNGDGTFRAAVNYGAGSVPASLAVGDFNGDGKLDLAVANNGSSNVSVLLGNGVGTFQAAVDYGVGANPGPVAVGDFNGDGKLDLVVATGGLAGTVSVLLGNGDGTFQAAVDYVVGSTPISVAVADFNGDGKLDLVVANYASNSLSVLLGNGDGTFRAAADYGVGSDPDSVAVGDFNGDGKLDLAVANFLSGNVSVLLGKGNGTFQPAVEYSQTASANEFVAVGDFNGDGRLDMVVAGNPIVVLLQGNISLSTESLKLTDQVVGTSSAAQAVTLTNIGPLGLSIRGIMVNGSNETDFSQTNTCHSRLPAGASCAISVTFKPTEIGPRNASVTITDDSPGSPQSVALSGTGVVLGPNATLSPSLTFATQLVGTTSLAQSLTLSNYGTATLDIASVVATADFSESNTCGSSLAAGANCTISVTFKPTQRGTRRGTLSVTDNASGSPQTVSLSGTGTVVTLSPASLSFFCQLGYRFRCVCKAFDVTTLTNVGSTPLDITGIAISGGFSQTNTCGTSVAAGNSCDIDVRWSPLSGSSGEISVSDNGGASPQTVSLTGHLYCRP